MKPLFTLLLLAAFTMLSAQDLTLSETEVQLDGYDEYIPYEQIILTNNSSSTLELGLRLERLCYDDMDETEIVICIGNSCFLGVSETTTWATDGSGTPYISVGPGATYDSLKFTPEEEIYGSEWNVVYFEIGNETNNAVLHVTVAECGALVTSTNDFEYEIGKAFPNPATDLINIPYQIDVNRAQLNIYNALGMQVESIDLNTQNESVSVNVADYVKGVYFYQVTDGKDQSRMLSFVK